MTGKTNTKICCFPYFHTTLACLSKNSFVLSLDSIDTVLSSLFCYFCRLNLDIALYCDGLSCGRLCCGCLCHGDLCCGWCCHCCQHHHQHHILIHETRCLHSTRFIQRMTQKEYIRPKKKIKKCHIWDTLSLLACAHSTANTKKLKIKNQMSGVTCHLSHVINANSHSHGPSPLLTPLVCTAGCCR